MPKQTVDFEVVRAIGAALPDVKDASGKRGTALKIKGRLLACEAIHKSAEPDTLLVSISHERRDELLTQSKEIYYVTDHYKPYSVVLVRLRKIQLPFLEQLLEESWEFMREQRA